MKRIFFKLLYGTKKTNLFSHFFRRFFFAKKVEFVVSKFPNLSTIQVTFPDSQSRTILYPQVSAEEGRGGDAEAAVRDGEEAVRDADEHAEGDGDVPGRAGARIPRPGGLLCRAPARIRAQGSSGSPKNENKYETSMKNMK